MKTTRNQPLSGHRLIVHNLKATGFRPTAGRPRKDGFKRFDHGSRPITMWVGRRGAIRFSLNGYTFDQAEPVDKTHRNELTSYCYL